MLIIYHNPRCSKSRETLERATLLSEEHGLPLHIVDYQQTPLTEDALADLHQALQSTQTTLVRDMIRSNEKEYATLNLAEADDAALFSAMASHPILLQRPIVRIDNRAIIARPPERIDLLLKR